MMEILKITLLVIILFYLLTKTLNFLANYVAFKVIEPGDLYVNKIDKECPYNPKIRYAKVISVRRGDDGTTWIEYRCFTHYKNSEDEYDTEAQYSTYINFVDIYEDVDNVE